MRRYAVINALASQACWWACILGASSGRPWIGPLGVASFLAVHLWWGTRSRRGAELRLIGLAALAGYVADSVLVVSGVLTFPPHASLGWPSTIWMVALWAGLAATLNASMAWLHGRYALAAIFGAVTGPLAYAAGERLGAATLGPTETVALVLIAVEWALALPALVWLAGRTAPEAGPRPAEPRPDPSNGKFGIQASRSSENPLGLVDGGESALERERS